MQHVCVSTSPGSRWYQLPAELRGSGRVGAGTSHLCLHGGVQLHSGAGWTQSGRSGECLIPVFGLGISHNCTPGSIPRFHSVYMVLNSISLSAC